MSLHYTQPSLNFDSFQLPIYQAILDQINYIRWNDVCDPSASSLDRQAALFEIANNDEIGIDTTFTCSSTGDYSGEQVEGSDGIDTWSFPCGGSLCRCGESI
jgi:hypothetical protein